MSNPAEVARLTAVLLREGLAVCDAATPGPWEAIYGAPHEHTDPPLAGRTILDWVIYTEATYPPDSVNNLRVASGYGGLSDGFPPLDQGGPNADLICLAVNAIYPLLEALLAEVELCQLHHAGSAIVERVPHREGQDKAPLVVAGYVNETTAAAIHRHAATALRALPTLPGADGLRVELEGRDG